MLLIASDGRTSIWCCSVARLLSLLMRVRYPLSILPTPAEPSSRKFNTLLGTHSLPVPNLIMSIQELAKPGSADLLNSID